MAQSTRSQRNAEAEIEIREKRLEEREKQLQEQAGALRAETEQTKSKSDNQDLNAILDALKTIHTEINTFRDIPLQIANLEQRVNEITRTTPSTEEAPEPLPPVTLKLKDVLPNIPTYDGHRMSIFQFARACERSRDLLPRSHEPALVQMIINKLQGDAYQVIENGQYYTITALLDKLKTIFAPNKTVAQYRGELANIYKLPGESILRYATKIKDLRTAIIDCHRRQRQLTDNEFIKEINEEVLQAFISGLPSDLIVRIEHRPISDLDEAIEWAVKLSKNIENEKIRERTHNRQQNNAQTHREPSRNDPSPNFSPPPIPRPTYRQPLEPPTICRYCKHPGHDINECRKLAYRKSLQQSGNLISQSATQGAAREGNVSITHPQAHTPESKTGQIQPEAMRNQ